MWDNDLDLAMMIGAAVRKTREECGWSRRELARRLGTGHSVIQRLEAGRSSRLDVRLVTAAFRELGIRADFDARTLGLATRREQRDLVHAACVAHVRRRLMHVGWDVRVEVEIGAGRFRGWIDLLAFRPADGALLSIEVKTRIDDVGRILRTTGWYRRESPAAARRLGWTARSTTPLLLVLASGENDVAITRNRDLLRSSFPASATALRTILEPGPAPRLSGALAMVDPRSRRSEWLRATASDGRRSAPAYVDYDDAATAIRGGRVMHQRTVTPPSKGATAFLATAAQ